MRMTATNGPAGRRSAATSHRSGRQASRDRRSRTAEYPHAPDCLVLGGYEIALGLDEAGDGPPVLLLPALSSVSTRREMLPLMRGLAREWHVLAPDWPGFGDQKRPPITWTPDALSAVLEWLVRERVGPLHATIAAGARPMQAAPAFSVIGLFLQADSVVKAVRLLLVAASVGVWTVVIEKAMRFGRLRRDARVLDRCCAG